MEWKISKGSEACCRCSKNIAEKEVYYSILNLDEEILQRGDYCSACFQEIPAPQKELFWRTRKSSSRLPKKTVNFEVLRDLFLKMLSVEEKDFKEVAYLLALILIRKRYLKLVEFTSLIGRDYMMVRQKKGAPKIKVEVPLLGEEEIAGLRDKLALLLDTDLDSSMDIREIREKIIQKPCEEPSSKP